MSEAKVLVFVVGAYLLGSVSFALLLTRWVKGVDLRSQGSGNLGATNAGRTLGRGYGLLVYVLDLLKGLVPTLVGEAVFPPSEHLLLDWLPVGPLMGAAAFLGHCYPVLLNFKGGKGVATASGVLLGLSWPLFLAAFIGFAVSLALFRMVSVSSMVAAAILPVGWLVQHKKLALQVPRIAILTMLLLLCITIIVRHRANIVRIVEKTEPKVGRRRPS